MFEAEQTSGVALCLNDSRWPAHSGAFFQSFCPQTAALRLIKKRTCRPSRQLTESRNTKIFVYAACSKIVPWLESRQPINWAQPGSSCAASLRGFPVPILYSAREADEFWARWFIVLRVSFHNRDKKKSRSE